MLAQQFNAFNCLAPSCVAGAEPACRKYRSWLHVFSQHFYCCGITRQKVTSHPIRASNKLAHLSHILERGEFLYGLGLFILMLRPSTPNSMTKEARLDGDDVCFIVTITESRQDRCIEKGLQGLKVLDQSW